MLTRAALTAFTIAVVSVGASAARAPVARADPTPAADAALVVIVVVGDGAGAAEVAARVDGQVSDLPVTLLRVDDAAWSATTRADPLAAAIRLATPRGAKVVVWFESDAAAWTVHVAEPDAGRILSRRVEAAGELAGSASAEAVALVVRAALEAIADGGSIGVVPARVIAPPAAPPPAAEAAPARASRRTFAALGWTGVAGGVGPAVQHGVIARLGATRDRWRAGVALGVHPAITVEEPGATMELSRAGLGVLVARDVVGGAGPAWLLSVELGAVATRFARVTTAADAPLAPTPSAVVWSPTLSPALRASRRVAPGTWLELSAGVDVVLRVPEFGLGAPGGFMSYAKMPPLQPQLTLGVVLDAL